MRSYIRPRVHASSRSWPPLRGKSPPMNRHCGAPRARGRGARPSSRDRRIERHGVAASRGSACGTPDRAGERRVRPIADVEIDRGGPREDRAVAPDVEAERPRSPRLVRPAARSSACSRSTRWTGPPHQSRGSRTRSPGDGNAGRRSARGRARAAAGAPARPRYLLAKPREIELRMPRESGQSRLAQGAPDDALDAARGLR